MKNFVRNGYGVMFYKDGRVYDVIIFIQGHWNNNIYNGIGHIIYSSDHFYKVMLKLRECLKGAINQVKDLRDIPMEIFMKFIIN